MLSSVGVGDSTASPTAALLLSILQESAGRIATILFADRFGTSLEPECKMYRLLADILNDIAFILDCLSPAFPKAIRVVILSFSSILRALCGVAAGSAKASLSAHFARWGNLGELNAKDSSQETVISLLGMLAGSFVVSWVTTPFATWSTLLLLLSIHLETNRRAVRAVSMRSLNRQRATLVYKHLIRGHVPDPEEISKQERIFEWDSILRNSDDRVLGHCRVGTSMSQILEGGALQHNRRTKSTQLPDGWLQNMLSLFSSQQYLLWYTSRGGYLHVNVVIKSRATSLDLLTAWWQALALVNALSNSKKSTSSTEASLELLEASNTSATKLLQKYEADLRKAGWDLDLGALETSSSTRITVEG